MCIEQSSKSVSLTHFHEEDQFQVITEGGGTLGRHAVSSLSIHYTNRHTAYGPIVAGENGLCYFTLRQIATNGAWFLVDSKSKQDQNAPKRQITVGPITAKAPDALQKLNNAELEVLIQVENDGLAVWLVRTLPCASISAPAHSGGTGRFYMVIAGSILLRGNELPPISLIFVSHDEEDFPILAGDMGLGVLVLQYPGGQRVLGRKAKPIGK